jgi:predicted lipoprotein with Yx(FWY)xxD motif
MYRKPRSMIPLAAAGIALLAGSTGCDMANTYSSAAGQDAMQDMATAAKTPALNAVRAFDLGPIVVDGGGFTVYRYDTDSANPPKSTCGGACAQQWKPVPVSATQHLDGLDQTAVGALTRDDGTDQATLHGWPLYRYAKDAMPGETAGMGVGGVWFPITPQGTKVMVVANPGQSDAFGL